MKGRGSHPSGLVLKGHGFLRMRLIHTAGTLNFM